MSVAVVIQARMGSTRLPGKVLLDLGGQSVLHHVIARCRLARTPSVVCVATTLDPSDDPIAEVAQQLGTEIVRGRVDDVLDRFHAVAAHLTPSHMVRVTADCPFIDPAFIDSCVDACITDGFDYVANDGAGYMRGFDVEVIATPALEIAWREASAPFERIHVTPYLYQNPNRFAVAHLDWPEIQPEQRLTLDTTEDLAVLRAVANHFGAIDTLPWQTIVKYLIDNPSVAAMNRQVAQKDVVEG